MTDFRKIGQVNEAEAQRIAAEDAARAEARRIEMARRAQSGEYVPHPPPSGRPAEFIVVPAGVEILWPGGTPDPSAIVTGAAAELIGKLHPDEPYFIFRAQDILSVMVLRNYAKLIEDYCSEGDQLANVVRWANKFTDWQRRNPGHVKLPD